MRAAPTSLAAAERRLCVRLALAMLTSLLIFQHGSFAGTDEVGVFETTRALFEGGSLAVPPGYHTFPGRDGRRYSHFAVGQSVLALPFYALGHGAAQVLPESWRRALAGPPAQLGLIRFGGSLEIAATSLYAPVATAVLSAIFFLWQRRLGASLRSASMATILLAATTYVGMMSVYFLQHTTEAIAILGGLYLLRRYAEGGELRTLAAASAVASSTLLVRVPALVAAPGLIGYALWALAAQRRQRERPFALGPALAALVLPTLAVVAIHVAVDQRKWGSWLASPMLAQRDAFSNPWSVGLGGFLLSPGCSVFAYSPLLLLAPWTFAGLWRRHRAECAAALAISLSFLFFCARFDAWTGLWSSPGPRYLFVATPLLLLPFGAWLDANRGRTARNAVIALAVLGLAVQLVLVCVRWPAVIELSHYREFVPPKGFVFVPLLSPIPAAARVLARGWLDPWVWNLAVGWEGWSGMPLAAVLVVLAWAGATAAAVRSALAALRDAEDREAGRTDCGAPLAGGGPHST